ncbi:uncharacterized protein LOC131637309 [Vicia villosa]|uniref:uncharacterized protein LOC131637309 n=1 Tax=Vicia villosa TaxID=3911 RepID=UPI00273B18D8|nr:uncharacterized protein LOC131637309 [Vicia villosa]XP_058763878.1 uncharacterized protein LOC131637309 [Vicia villosa]XP_058763879.1 uncharacterized protein LOC131637309 [Vicia villosa]
MERVVTRSQRLKSLNNCSSSSYNDDSDSSKVLLNQDMMLPILSLLPLNCLLNSVRYVCKPWATTIRTSHFAQACLQLTKPGLYVEDYGSPTSSYYLDIKSYVNGHFEFERISLGTPSKVGTIICSYNGILLMLDWDLFSSQPPQAFLVNPLIKSLLKLPPLPYSLERPYPSAQFAIVSAPHTAKFKLFFIDILEVSGALYYVFYVLRIGIDISWKEIDRKEAPIAWNTIWKPLYDGSNYLYWISAHHQVTVFDVDKEITVGKFPLPPLHPDPFSPFSFSHTVFLWRGNQISCIVSIVENKRYKIYILDFDSGKWSLYHEMGPFDYVAACGQEFFVKFLLFRCWIHDEIIFRVSRSSTREENLPIGGRYTMHFSYNVKTRRVTKIEDIAMFNNEVWLHTNSLFSLPSTPT